MMVHSHTSTATHAKKVEFMIHRENNAQHAPRSMALSAANARQASVQLAKKATS